MNTFNRVALMLALVAALAAPVCAGIPAEIVEKFESASNAETPIGVTDGNPLAATAVFSNSMYRELGFEFDRSNHFGMSIDGSYGQFSSGGIHDGDFASADLSMGFAIGHHFGLIANTALGYRDTFGAKVYLAGFGIAAPITLSEGDVAWTLSPWGLIGVADGSDLAQGGIQYGGGATSSLGVKVLENRVRLSMANQVAYFAGDPFGYNSHFNFEQNVSQFILKNGFEAAGRITDTIHAYGSISYTNLLRDAFVDSYWTPELGMRFHAEHFSASLAGFGDFGDRYDGYGARVMISFDW